MANELFRQARLRLGLTRQQVADAANALLPAHSVLSANDIGKVERGLVAFPRETRRQALRTVLQATSDAEIGLYDTRRDTPVTPAKLPDDGWGSFLTVTRLLASQRQAVAPAALLSLVEAHRDCLSMLYDKATGDPLRAVIGSLLAEASIVASRLWSAQGNRPMAVAHCAYARKLADRLGDVANAAVARIFESNLRSDAATLMGSDGDVVIGLRLLDEAAACESVLQPAARARLWAERAQIFAVLQMRRECEASLRSAGSAAREIGDEDRVGLFSDWNHNRLFVYEGTCCLFLNENERAVEVLTEAVARSETDLSNANVRLAARVDLAGAQAGAGVLTSPARSSPTLTGNSSRSAIVGV